MPAIFGAIAVIALLYIGFWIALVGGAGYIGYFLLKYIGEKYTDRQWQKEQVRLAKRAEQEELRKQIRSLRAKTDALEKHTQQLQREKNV